MLTSNLLTPVGQHNGARGKVIDVVYMKSDGRQSQTSPEPVVVKISHLQIEIPASLEYYPGIVSIPTIPSEWTKTSGNRVFIRNQFPLNLSWAFTIHKSRGKTLKRLVINFGEGEK